MKDGPAKESVQQHNIKSCNFIYWKFLGFPTATSQRQEPHTHKCKTTSVGRVCRARRRVAG